MSIGQRSNGEKHSRAEGTGNWYVCGGLFLYEVS